MSVSDACFYMSCDTCEEPECTDSCHQDEEFSPFYGWTPIEEHYGEDE